MNDQVHGFEPGADDYLRTPFALEALVLRITSLIRRPEQLSETTCQLRHGPIAYVLASHLAFWDGVELKFTRKGLQIMELLLRYGTRVVPRDKLEKRRW